MAVDMAVQTKGRLKFDIFLSVAPTPTQTPKPKDADQDVPKSKNVMDSLMKDISTMNMAFTFGFNGSARNVALWVHQSILMQQSSFSSLIGKLKDIKGDSSSAEAVSGVKTTHVTEYSLEAYCTLIRYLYTSEIMLEVHLDDFAIGCPPNKPFSSSCKMRPIVDGLFFAKVSSFSTSPEIGGPVEPRRAATWCDLFQIADCYQVTDLREYCLNKIVGSLDASTALEVLFGFAYHYPDLKTIVLQAVADNMPSLYAASQDPFVAFEDHCERQVLMAEAFQLVFKAKAQI